LNPETPQERPLTSKVANLRLKKGDLFSWEMGGGGGWGNPFERDPELVRQDVVRGYVSLDAARLDYGVVLNRSDASIDHEATIQLRSTGGVHAEPAGRGQS
jgi:N-methylhydantoinase B